jgi:predicted metal-binding membrane protein
MVALLVAPRSIVHRRLVAALALITGLAWVYLFFLSARMGDMGSPFAMPMTSSWTSSDVALMWTMWAVMMAGMMLPSATPMIVAYATTAKSDVDGHRGSTPWFVAGYLAAWSGFAALATAAQWALHDSALVSAMGATTSARVGGLLLLGAGVYQFSTVKDACLKQCRSPLGFLLNQWRSGRDGAFVMGLHHGALCVGCCWALMALLFVLGVMNLWWIALVAAVVLLEKVVPTDHFSRGLGAVLLLWGTGLVFGLGF